MNKKEVIHANIDTQTLGRKIRKEPLEQMGKSSWDILIEEIEAGNAENALTLVDYMMIEGKNLHDGYCDWLWADMDFVARNYGEEEIPKMIRNAYAVLSKSCYKPIPGTGLADMVMIGAEFNRSHKGGPGERGNITITEDDEKYIMTFNPCGSGQRMRRTGEIDGLPPRNEEPLNLGVTSQPYTWSWSKAGVPYYCAHCCVMNEQITSEGLGYPLRVTMYSDDPSVPCAFHYYKNPDNIPEEYFTRIGKVKDPSKFIRLKDHEK